MAYPSVPQQVGFATRLRCSRGKVLRIGRPLFHRLFFGPVYRLTASINVRNVTMLSTLFKL
jgi:hypothetical protein